MPMPLEHSRINIGALKSQIARRLGPDRSFMYFNSLNRLLALKLTKQEFQRSCLLTLGRENIALHNQLVLGILKNACIVNEPPPARPSQPNRKPSVTKLQHRRHSSVPPASVKSNGDILPPSLSKVLSGVRRIKDHLSPLGPNGRAEVGAHQNSTPCEEVLGRENCGLSQPCDLKRPLQHLEAGSAEQLHKRPCSGDISNWQHVHNKSVVDEVTGPTKEEIEQSPSLRGPLRAPLGIPFCHASVGGAQKPSPLQPVGNFSSFSSNYDTGELCNTEDLKERMEKIAETQGLGTVSVECANLLNIGMDSYLKRLIKSCVELVGARSGSIPASSMVNKQQPNLKEVNSVSPGSPFHLQGSNSCVEGLVENKNQHVVSLHDFKIAMELNPLQLGEDWPLLLEKVSIQTFGNEGR